MNKGMKNLYGQLSTPLLKMRLEQLEALGEPTVQDFEKIRVIKTILARREADAPQE